MNTQYFENIAKVMEDGDEHAPFLFLGNNLELLGVQLLGFLREKMKEYGVDAQSLFTLTDGGETLKIEQVKQFLQAGDMRPRHAFQIFFIENISRMTPQSQNACLKFFEEPGKGNIIILTNASQNGILDTILSRVTLCTTGYQKLSESGQFYTSLLEEYVTRQNTNLISYFFQQKLEKQDYIDFLLALTHYISTHKTHIYLLDELEEDIAGIMKNNLQGKYIVDKYILEL